MEQFSRWPFQDLGFAKLDHHRAVRKASSEVVFAPGKSREQLLSILRALRDEHQRALATRVEPATAEWLLGQDEFSWDREARIVSAGSPKTPSEGFVVVACAGTSDLPVAQEAAFVSNWLGDQVELVADVGVAGIHRLFSRLETLRKARAIIAVAGMDGAMPSVIAGLVDCPVFAVPTSVGYGSSFQGVAALLAMLNSCAPGLSVVNIDNGFGAAYSAHLVNRQESKG